jgi:transposase
LRLLAQYGGPGKLCEDAEAAQQLKRWGGRFLKQEKVQSLLDAARGTVGVRMTEPDRKRMKRYAQEALRAHGEIGRARRGLKVLAEKDETVQRVARAVGSTTASVVCATLGEPAKYHCGGAYRKAMGLNLKERSSGKHQGKLKITKRGPGIARRWLYFAALRIVQQSPVRRWYERKKKKDQNRGKGALVAVMRKLALAIYAVATRDEPFDLKRLFPGRPLTRKRAA